VKFMQEKKNRKRKVVFKQQPASRPELFPENIFDRIPSNHPVRLVDEVVNQLDIEAIIKLYKGGGTSAYHPKMMIKVLFYSYLSNIYSCRKIAKALRENIAFMYISGNSTPDFRTINEFRSKILKGQIENLFKQTVEMLVELGYVSLETQYIDGTKIEASSNRYTFVWRKTVEKNKAKVLEKVNRILADIEAHIQADNQAQNEEVIPQEMDLEALKKRITELNQQLKTPAKKIAKKLEKIQQEHLPKLEEYEQKLQTLGDRNSYSKTDKDASFMRMKDDHLKNGQLKPAYNVQISTENQFITHATIHQNPTDTNTLPKHLATFEEAYGEKTKVICADAGYGSQNNYELLEAKNIEAYIKYPGFEWEKKKANQTNPFLVQNLFYNAEKDFYVCPMGQRMELFYVSQKLEEQGYVVEIKHYRAKNCENCPLRGLCHKSAGNRVITVNHRLNQLRQQAKERLKTTQGQAHLKKRPVEVEAVFGQLKSNNKFNRFTFKGLEKVELEFLLMSIGHNLRKMTAKGLCNLFFAIADLQNLIFYHLLAASLKKRPRCRTLAKASSA
jgi:transposase